MSNQGSVERYRSLVDRELHAHESRLRSLGIGWDGPVLDLWKPQEEEHTCELRVDFLSNGQVFDVFEFFVTWDGQLQITEGELVEWMRENLERLLRRR